MLGGEKHPYVTMLVKLPKSNNAPYKYIFMNNKGLYIKDVYSQERGGFVKC